MILASSKEGDLILDCFGGSGTTFECSIENNRDCITIEKDDFNYDMIKKRVGKIFKNYGIDLQTLLYGRM